MSERTRVFHRQFGWGYVRNTDPLATPPRAVVDFGYASLPCLVSDLLDGPDGPSAELVEEDTVHSSDCPQQARLADPARRQSIVALRLGQILESKVRTLSVATEDVEKIYARVIDDVLTCKPRVVLLDGPWGAGKTHALTLLRTLAREKGLATSSTILEGSGASLCDPLRLLTCVTGSICYPDSVLPVSIGDRLLDGRRSPSVIYKLRMAGANILADVLDALSEESLVSQEIRHTVEDYLAGALPASRAKQKLRELDCRANLPPVLARSVNERSGRFVLMLQNWAHFAALTGAKGLIVILDELDVEYALHRDYRGLREQLLTELKALTNRSAPLLVACAAAPADGANGDVDGQDAVKNVLKHLRSAVTHIRVPSPSGADLLTLFGRLITAYNEAYPPFALAGDETMADSLFAQLYRRYRKRLDAGPRYFIRSAVELFDVIATSGVTTAPEVCTLLASTSEDD